ncbi:MAG TPA: clostripain-related cysteine peptidase [Thermoleophilia bacterium]|nr:clostripain-related cysteine peptidase [Thermoleophilia bacterium]
MERRPIISFAAVCLLALLGACGVTSAAALAVGAESATTPVWGAAPATVGAPVVPAEPADWTVAVYANGDNDLMYTWPMYTRPALQGIPPSADVNVVVMLDKPKKDGAWLYKVSGASVQLVRQYSKERDFGSGATFEWFLGQVHRMFPSKHLLVDGWDHGFAWHRFSRDFASNDAILLPQLTRAIRRSGVHIDILAFDACNMADVSVASALSATHLVDELVASEETVDENGYPYDAMLTPLAARPEETPRAVVADMLDGWERYYGTRRNFNWVTLSATDLGEVAAMKTDLAAWVKRLHAGLPAFAHRYRVALSHSLWAWDSWQLDLGGFAGRLAADPRISDAALRTASARVRDDVDHAVLGVTSGSLAQGFTGLSIWAGTGSDWKTYARDFRRLVAFGRPAARGGTGWYAFLRAFNASGGADPREPNYLVSLHRPAYGLTAVAAGGPGRCWASGYDNLTNTSVLVRSGDGGRTWKTSDESSLGNYLFSAVTLAPDGRLWAAGDYGYDDSIIAVSSDGGRSWAQRRSGTQQSLFGIDFPDARHGWACGAAGMLVRSADGGKTWKRTPSAPPGELLALDFVDASHGWVVADDLRGPAGAVWYTADAGRHWTLEHSTPGSLLYAVTVVGDAVYVAGGDPAGGAGLIVRGGLAGPWTLQWSGSPRIGGVAISAAGSGWAVGDGGLILHTVDGGATWTTQAAGVDRDLAGVCAVDGRTAIVVGDGEPILRTADGGATWSSSRAAVPGQAAARLTPGKLRR